jgi:hypothetical protein
MANDIKKQSSVFTKEALRILENTLVMTKKVHTDYNSEFSQKVNGMKKGDTVSVRRPADFTVRTGATRSNQDVEEGSTTITMNNQIGVDVGFTSKEMTTDIDKSGVRERVLKPAMIQLADYIDRQIMDLYKYVPSWQGTPGQTIDAFTDFAKGPQRMDELSVPTERCGVLSPADHWGLLGGQAALQASDKLVQDAYTMARLGNIGGVETYAAQNVPTHTVGAHGGTPLVNGGSQNDTYATAKDTSNFTSSLVTDGWTTSTEVLKAGDVFTIAGVYAVNPVSKAKLPFLRQFTVVSDVTSDGSGNATLTVSPAMISSGAQATIDSVPADNAAITVMGTASTGYRQNMIFHKNAFAFVSAPMEMPASAYGGTRESYKGISLRLIPGYDHTNDIESWRFDVLFGTKAIDPRLATRLSGTA